MDHVAGSGTVQLSWFADDVIFDDGDIAVGLRTRSAEDDEYEVDFIARDGRVVLGWCRNSDLTECLAEHQLMENIVGFAQDAWDGPVTINSVVAVEVTLSALGEVG